MRPFTIPSFWDVLQIEGANLLAAASYLGACVKSWRLHQQLIEKDISPPLLIDDETKVHFLNSIERIRDMAIMLDMVATVAAGERAFGECLNRVAVPVCRLSARDIENLTLQIDRLLHVFSDEMRARVLFVMPSKHAVFYSDEKPLFGAEVDDAFPSAAPDIAEAGKCRAVGRWTACVMHLMRALEIGLGALAKFSGVDPDENWNTLLGQIEANLRKIGKKSHSPADEQFAAEAATHFRAIKNGWRNHAMHVREKYDEERAVAIYDSVRSFMRHLATRLGE